MKVYLNNRIIHFTATGPDTKTAEDMIIVCDTRKKLKKAFRDFESDSTIHHLYLQYQSDKHKREIIDDFLALFKIVEAAGGVVKNDYGEILFIHRLGYWDLPKGKISRKDRKTADKRTGGQADGWTGDLTVSDFRFPFTDNQHPASSIQHPASSIQHPASSVQHPASSIQHPASSIQHPASSIQHPASNIQHPAYARIAAIREVQEETGLVKLTVTGELSETWHIYTRGGNKILKCTYWFGMSADVLQTLTPQTEEDIMEVRWISPSEFDDIREKCYASLRDLF